MRTDGGAAVVPAVFSQDTGAAGQGNPTPCGHRTPSRAPGIPGAGANLCPRGEEAGESRQRGKPKRAWCAPGLPAPGGVPEGRGSAGRPGLPRNGGKRQGGSQCLGTAGNGISEGKVRVQRCPRSPRAENERWRAAGAVTYGARRQLRSSKRRRSPWRRRRAAATAPLPTGASATSARAETTKASP